MEKEKSPRRKKIPLSIFVIGILLAALIGALSGLYSINIAMVGNHYATKSAVIFVAGVFSLLLAYGLWKGAKWGWGLGIVVSIILIVTIFVFDLISFIAGVVILYYLLKKRTRQYFGIPEAQAVLELASSYGWMILILVVALGVLYAYGAFTSSAFVARGPPGDCTVYRAGGPGSLESVNLEGVCDGELPQFVARFGYTGPKEEFGNSNVTVPATHFLPTITKKTGEFAMTGWVYTFPPGPIESVFGIVNVSDCVNNCKASGASDVEIDINAQDFCNHGLVTYFWTVETCVYSKTVPTYTWMFVAMEDNGTNTIGYAVINGNVYTGTNSVSLASVDFVIGQGAGTTIMSFPYNGILTNVQLYNTSLTQNSLYQLYKEGIAGAPINLQNLVGWWPLNGNLNDYSGNGNGGYAYNTVDVSGAYYNNYTQP